MLLVEQERILHLGERDKPGAMGVHVLRAAML